MNLIAAEVSRRCFHQELEAARALRHPPKECYDRACDVLAEVYNMALDPMPAEVWPVRSNPQTKPSIWGPDGWIDEMRKS